MVNISSEEYPNLTVFDCFRSDIEPVPDNPQHEQYVAGLLNSLVQELENKASGVTDAEFFLTKLKLAEAAKMFRQRYR